MKKKIVFLTSLFLSLSTFGADGNIDISNPENVVVKDVNVLPEPDLILTYKKVDEAKIKDIKMKIYYPNGVKPKKPLPAAIFFGGGGWNSANAKQFSMTSRVLADLGMVSIFADYRTKSTMGRDAPDVCVEDAKSAVRYVRENAAELGVNPDMIATGGGSAGGHVAIATALLDKFDSPKDNLEISCKPNLLLLYNPVMDNSEYGYGYTRVKKLFPDISPFHNLTKDVPPSLVMVGTLDTLCKAEMCKKYKEYLDANGVDCQLYIFEGKKHSFFNPWSGKDIYLEVTNKVIAFLRKHKYLN
ncbi:MAG: alpha/beta hydrolase [Opitutales bacterium]